MKFLSAAAVAMLAATPVFACAAPVLLDFETVTSFAPVNDLYAGFGIAFTGDALGLVNDALGPYFSNAPSPVGVMTPVGGDATMNVANGFTDAFSFFYTSSDAVANAVQVWSEINGGGSLLKSFNLAANAQDGGCSDTSFCHFDILSAAFPGTARSVTFGNAAGSAAFDNAVLGVPEPTTALLIPLALAGLLVARRRA